MALSNPNRPTPLLRGFWVSHYLSVIYDGSTSLQIAMIPRIRVCTVLGSYLTGLADSAHHPDPTTPFQSARPSSSVPDLGGSAVGPLAGEITRR
jgi:hypothetical protein